ncbi:MAG TPA: SDR family oxidoreductase [Bdellovibrionota bacterium]|jgi:short-subunit dehydrogenase
MKKILSYALVSILSAAIALFGAFYALNKRNAFDRFQKPATEQEKQERLAKLEGKVVLITGASGGIGSAFAKEAAKYKMKVALTDIDLGVSNALVEEFKKSGVEAMAIQVDLRSQAEREKLVKEVLQRFGRVDMLINNAGYLYLAQPDELSMADAKASFEVNFFAYVDLARLVLPLMKKNGEGTIVNISSVLGHWPVVSGLAQNGLNGMYTGAKAAVNSWSQVLQRALINSNIKVRVVSPSGVRTGFWKHTQGPEKQKALDESGRLWQFYDDPETVAKDAFLGIVDNPIFIFPGHARALFNAFELEKETNFREK